MEYLIKQLRTLLANTLTLYYKAHVLHWNVDGADFPQYHAFFGDIYEELFDALDPIAEQLRQLDQKVPANIAALLGTATVADDMSEDDSFVDMVQNFQTANNLTIEILRSAIATADAATEPAVSNFLQDRLGAHQKLAWKIRSLFVK